MANKNKTKKKDDDTPAVITSTDSENAPVEGQTAGQMAAGALVAGASGASAADDEADELPAAPTTDENMQPILYTTNPLGFWIDGKLHRFRKGRTPLTKEQEVACLGPERKYLTDKKAEVLYRPKRK